MSLLKPLELGEFTDSDYEIIQTFPVPSRLNTFLVVAAARLGNSSARYTIPASFLRAQQNAEHILENRALCSETRKYLEKYRK